VVTLLYEKFIHGKMFTVHLGTKCSESVHQRVAYLIEHEAYQQAFIACSAMGEMTGVMYIVTCRGCVWLIDGFWIG
jgi:hypothetical protein